MIQENKPRQTKRGDRQGTKVTCAHWKAFFATCDVFRELVTKVECGAIINSASESGGSDNGSSPSQIDFAIDFELAVRRTFDETKRRAFYLWIFLNDDKGAESYANLGREFLRRGLYPLGRYFSSTKGFNEQTTSMKKALRPKVRKLKAKSVPEVQVDEVQADEVQAEVEEHYVTQQYEQTETIAEDINAFEHQHVGFSFEDFEEAVACD